jgi:hypothetical protein
LAAAKIYAGRERDVECVEAVITYNLLDLGLLVERLDSLPPDEKRDLARLRLADFKPRLSPPT